MKPDHARVHPLAALVLAMLRAFDNELHPPERGDLVGLKKSREADQRAPKVPERWAA